MSFTEVWVTVRRLRFPGLFSVFRLILTVLWPSWSQLFLWVLVPTVSFQAFGDHSRGSNYNWYHHHLHIPLLFHLSDKIQVFSLLPLPFIFPLWSTEMAKSTRGQVLFFMSINTKSGRLAGIRWSVGISKSHQNFMRLIFSNKFSFVHLLFVRKVNLLISVTK